MYLLHPVDYWTLWRCGGAPHTNTKIHSPKTNTPVHMNATPDGRTAGTNNLAHLSYVRFYSTPGGTIHTWNTWFTRHIYTPHATHTWLTLPLAFLIRGASDLYTHALARQPVDAHLKFKTPSVQKSWTTTASPHHCPCVVAREMDKFTRLSYSLMHSKRCK